jgi:hypothetical protein
MSLSNGLRRTQKPQRIPQKPEHLIPNPITAMLREAAKQGALTMPAICDAIDFFESAISNPIPATVAALEPDLLAFAASLGGTGNFLYDIASEAAIIHMSETLSDEACRRSPVRYRRGHINHAIEAGVPYTGMIQGFKVVPAYDLVASEEPYVRWDMDLLLSPGVAGDGGRDVIEMIADSQVIESGPFDPERFKDEFVRVTLGDYVHESTYRRFIKTIQTISINETTWLDDIGKPSFPPRNVIPAK